MRQASAPRLKYFTGHVILSEIAGVYAFDGDSRSECLANGYVIDGNGVLALHSDGNVVASEGHLQVCMNYRGQKGELRDNASEGFCEEVIPFGASEGRWSILANNLGEKYVSICFERAHANKQLSSLYIKKNTTNGGYMLCPDLDPDKCVTSMKRVSLIKTGL